jgi:aldose 1-epimerase
VQIYTLTNAKGMSVRVLTLGGAVDQVNVPDRQGRSANVVFSLPDLKAYEGQTTVNTLVGRYANRIRGGFTLDGVHYPLQQNARGVTGHGGPPSYGTRVWTAEPVAAPAGAAAVRLKLVSPDGDQGFPGALNISVTYTVTAANELRLDYEATTDKPTVLNLTLHPYFNLRGSGSVYDHRLQILADNTTEVDADLVPSGKMFPVAGTALDFRRFTPVGARIRSTEPQMLYGRGYDHNFVVNKGSDSLRLVARLHDPESGRLLEVETTEPGMQVYTANHFNGTVRNAAGQMIRQSDGIALETQRHPNTPNIPAFPSAVLRPGETWRSTTVYRFATDGGRAPE